MGWWWLGRGRAYFRARKKAKTLLISIVWKFTWVTVLLWNLMWKNIWKCYMNKTCFSLQYFGTWLAANMYKATKSIQITVWAHFQCSRSCRCFWKFLDLWLIFFSIILSHSWKKTHLTSHFFFNGKASSEHSSLLRC